MRARADRLDPPQRTCLEHLLQTDQVLQPILVIKEQLWMLLPLTAQTRQTCRWHARSLLELIGNLRASGLQPAVALANPLADWSAEIARRWRLLRNNGITESFHRKVKLIQRRAYGFRKSEN